MRSEFLQIGILLGLSVAGSGMALAEVHNVTVLDGSFSPNEVAIQPGDTVRWTLTPPPDDGCEYYCVPGDVPSHTVTADDGSFSSGPPADSFVFEHVFEDPGEYPYYCEVHSAPGRDINQFMNGLVVVEGEPAGGFLINAGLNDAWFDPATAGQGMFITVFPTIQRMFFAWFTYDTERPPPNVEAVLGEPGHRWLTAFGPYDGSTAVLDIELTSGGVFDAAQPMPDAIPDGSMVIEFTDCNAALVTFDMPLHGLQGQISIQRIAIDNVPLCEAGAAR